MRGNWQGGRKHQIRPQRESWQPPGVEKGWGRGAPLSHGCPRAAPRGDHVLPCSDHLSRARAGRKEMVCCYWGWQVTKLELSVQWRLDGEAVTFCRQSRHGVSEAVVAEANLPVVGPHLRSSGGLTVTSSLCTYENADLDRYIHSPKVS